MEIPRLETHIDRIAHNTSTVISQCGAQGIQVAAVTKVMQTRLTLLWALKGPGCVVLTDSRIDSLKQIAETGLDLLIILLRAPTPDNAPEAVCWTDHILISSYQTTEMLLNAVKMAGVCHRVVMMVDVGGLREGVWSGRVVEEVSRIVRLPHLEVAGLGTNLVCFGGVTPAREKMGMLVILRDEYRSVIGHPLELASDGNSANLPLLASEEVSAGINNLRIGEVIILGCNVLDRSPRPGTRQDAMELIGGIVELQYEPSVPIGRTGQNAFGNTTHFTGRESRLHTVCGLGRQDTVPDTIEPVDPGIEALGASSNHLVIDAIDVETPVKVGSEIRFLSSYKGLLSASAPPHVWKMATGRP